jgi:hypothetical protein
VPRAERRASRWGSASRTRCEAERHGARARQGAGLPQEASGRAVGGHRTCATPPDASAPDEPPIACSLSPSDLANRRDQLLPGRIERAAEVHDLEEGLALRFDAAPGLLAELTAVIEQERICCSFLRFTIAVEPAGGPVVLEVSGPPGTREVLCAL